MGASWLYHVCFLFDSWIIDTLTPAPTFYRSIALSKKVLQTVAGSGSRWLLLSSIQPCLGVNRGGSTGDHFDGLRRIHHHFLGTVLANRDACRVERNIGINVKPPPFVVWKYSLCFRFLEPENSDEAKVQHPTIIWKTCSLKVAMLLCVWEPQECLSIGH